MKRIILLFTLIITLNNFSYAESLTDIYQISPEIVQKEIKRIGINEFVKQEALGARHTLNKHDGILTIDTTTSMVNAIARNEYLVLYYIINLEVLFDIIAKRENINLSEEERNAAHEYYKTHGKDAIAELIPEIKNINAEKFCSIPLYKAIFEGNGKMEFIYSSMHSGERIGSFVLTILNCNR